MSLEIPEVDEKAREQEFVTVLQSLYLHMPQANTPAQSHWHDCDTQTSSFPSRKWTVEVLLGQ